MDQYLSTVVISIITGIFSVITILIQRRQDTVMDKIDEQALFIKKERTLEKRLFRKEKERSYIAHNIVLELLAVNIEALRCGAIKGDPEVLNKIIEDSKKLRDEYYECDKEIQSIRNEYNYLLSITSELKQHTEIEEENTNKKKKKK